MKSIDRDIIRKTLERWQKKQLDERSVHEWAEDLFEKSKLPELPESDPLSIAIEVLCQLEVLNVQLITPEDIPAMLEFLNTPDGQEVQAWKKWENYLDSMDVEARKRALANKPYYSTS